MFFVFSFLAVTDLSSAGIPVQTWLCTSYASLLSSTWVGQCHITDYRHNKRAVSPACRLCLTDTQPLFYRSPTTTGSLQLFELVVPSSSGKNPPFKILATGMRRDVSSQHGRLRDSGTEDLRCYPMRCDQQKELLARVM
ncbi:hypothetical protein Bbelb_385900 [Branchiostoma belcheri]|nr:hypothetical protein Bbelb_385900 [Branchiostoma belcheri]